jgi:hypothetical protein
VRQGDEKTLAVLDAKGLRGICGEVDTVHQILNSEPLPVLDAKGLRGLCCAVDLSELEPLVARVLLSELGSSLLPHGLKLLAPVTPRGIKVHHHHVVLVVRGLEVVSGEDEGRVWAVVYDILGMIELLCPLLKLVDLPAVGIEADLNRFDDSGSGIWPAIQALGATASRNVTLVLCGMRRCVWVLGIPWRHGPRDQRRVCP